MIVEGIGGLLTPLAEGMTVADLAIRLDYPLVIVARRGLGTLNHTLLTVEAALGRGLRVAGVVLNGAGPTPRARPWPSRPTPTSWPVASMGRRPCSRKSPTARARAGRTPRSGRSIGREGPIPSPLVRLEVGRRLGAKPFHDPPNGRDFVRNRRVGFSLPSFVIDGRLKPTLGGRPASERILDRRRDPRIEDHPAPASG